MFVDVRETLDARFSWTALIKTSCGTTQLGVKQKRRRMQQPETLPSAAVTTADATSGPQAAVAQPALIKNTQWADLVMVIVLICAALAALPIGQHFDELKPALRFAPP
jgi:hypothetical protein